ncbi:MAG: hypothetical protein KDE66_03080 [Nitrosomonas sp.]|nr:hypothetical protein [Nitrosomonas sp.]MCP5251034.1 hypothetical protein [Burkholderiales bacterium]HQU61980.1 hypothetical protein [Nitrosomonas sp.]
MICGIKWTYAVKSRSLPIKPMESLELLKLSLDAFIPRSIRAGNESVIPGVSTEDLAMLPHFLPAFPD